MGEDLEDASPKPESGEGLVAEQAPTQPEAPGRDRGRAVGLVAIGALLLVGLGLILASPRRATSSSKPAAATAEPSGSASADGAGRAPPEGEGALAPAALVASTPVVVARPAPVWRVASLKQDATFEVTEGTFGKNGFVHALTQAGIGRAEIKRVALAFEGKKFFEHPAPTDSFVVAKDKAKGIVVAFEYATSPLDVWQARLEEGEDAQEGDHRLVGKKLDLFVEHKRVASGLVIVGDLAKAIAGAGLRPEIALAIDDALEGHVEPGGIRAGARLRIAATEDWVEGSFGRVRVDAIEFIPTSSGGQRSSPLRVYFYERDGSVEGSHRHVPLPGFYDAKGKQPYRGAFRSPLPLARVTSRFNPKRMHPVLKVVMPHQGVDYGATTGTPVYASAAGNVVTAGNGGPCGNMVEIAHAGGINTVYCHLKGFAQGLHSGQKVEARQLIGYVGQTGRVTGPHLHFGVKRNGMFVDPLGLKMDGIRVLPPADRDAFARKRADVDAVIDGVALPSAADIPDENEEKDFHAE